jgi:hypothetical protein
MKQLKRLIYIFQIPIFYLYISIPFFWVIDILYWVLFERDLFKDWSSYNNL